MSREGSSPELPQLGRVGVFSQRLLRLPRLQGFLRAEALVFRPSDGAARRLDGVIGWGHKPTAAPARAYAKRHGLRYYALEDGFFRSVGLGRHEPPLSLLVDDLGIYYDAHQPSRLEQLLVAARSSTSPLADPTLLARAAALRERVVATGVSKYNNAPCSTSIPGPEEQPAVLVVDQTFDDASIALGRGSAASFEQMLEAALDEHPTAPIYLKVHPETAAGLKRGYLSQPLGNPRVCLLGDNVDPQRLLRRISEAYVCTSQMGFEAVLAGKKVHCFAVPFYAGWGLTVDRGPKPERRAPRAVDELVAAALLLYPRYLEPVTGEPTEAEVVVEHLALQRERFRQNDRQFVCFGFSHWKRPFVRTFLQSPGRQPKFIGSRRAALAVPPSADLVALNWASRTPPWLREWAEQRGVPIWQMEDGFLRSVRLGSELTRPASLVIDRSGIYYDSSTPSDLETLLTEAQFSDDELRRAAHLREFIVQSRVSKYNPPLQDSLTLPEARDREIVLVPGQVPGDASLRRGSPQVRDDASLLRAAREMAPKAYLLYKPHPDLLSGNRRGLLPSPSLGLWDAMSTDATLSACLGACQAVHTMTSLVGFEALLRGLRVVTYGQPFYSGWGLTTDTSPPQRRKRKLTLDELVAGVLIRYPVYFSQTADAFATPEQVVHELSSTRGRRPGQRHRKLPWPVRRARDVGVLALEWLRAR